MIGSKLGGINHASHAQSLVEKIIPPPAFTRVMTCQGCISAYHVGVLIDLEPLGVMGTRTRVVQGGARKGAEGGSAKYFSEAVPTRVLVLTSFPDEWPIKPNALCLARVLSPPLIATIQHRTVTTSTHTFERIRCAQSDLADSKRTALATRLVPGARTVACL